MIVQLRLEPLEVRLRRVAGERRRLYPAAGGETLVEPAPRIALEARSSVSPASTWYTGNW